jgi:hypothetical protein
MLSGSRDIPVTFTCCVQQSPDDENSEIVLAISETITDVRIWASRGILGLVLLQVQGKSQPITGRRDLKDATYSSSFR